MFSEKSIENPEKIKDLLKYDPITGVFIWIGKSASRANRVKIGSKAGSYDPKGYIIISIFKVRILAHRLAWYFVHGEFPKNNIDHINCDPSDNRIENLRDISQAINSQNSRTARVNNKSGYLGVHFSKVSNKWTSQITIDRKCKSLGFFKSPEEAHKAYLKAKRELHEGCTI
jgi:hypothetical protein